MNKGRKLIAVTVGLFFLLAAGLAISGTKVDDVIKMNNGKAYTKHTKGIATFTHKKHNEEYKIDCGECHHDAKGVPLKLKMGDDVQPCLDCHIKGKASRAKMKTMSPAEKKKEKLKYHEGAIHENCQGCHEKFNKEKTGNARKGPAPVSCTKCHPKVAR